MNIKQQIIDLDKKIPNVLFVGSGIDYNKLFSWLEVIQKVSENEENISKLKKGNIFQVPNTILTFALSATDDTERKNAYLRALGDYPYTENEKIKELLNLSFDAILTTNYTYEWERSINPKYPSLSDEAKRNYSFATDSKREKYLLHTYNQIGESPPIWHVHGELRRKSSIILSHDEYARLVGKILEYNSKRKNYYEIYRNKLNMKSWIDYFITGNIYFLGYSLDFSEFDVWWLLGRKLRERSEVGRVYFYEPKTERNINKHNVLKMRGFHVENMEYDINDKNNSYDEFYKLAIDDIAHKIME